MSIKKKYLIELFLKCSGHRFAAERNLKISESLLRASYPSINDDEFSVIMSENGLDLYLEKITTIIDSMFSQEEMETLIAFFRSPVGRKMVDKTYLLKIPIIINDITNERERKLSKMDRE
jgi:hypothetical protein